MPITARKPSLGPASTDSQNSFFFRTDANSPKLIGMMQPQMLQEINTLSGQLGQKANINPRVKDKELDIKNPKERYNVKYVPPGGVTFISPITSMKYNLSKQQLKLQGQFTQRLKEAILEN